MTVRLNHPVSIGVRPSRQFKPGPSFSPAASDKRSVSFSGRSSLGLWQALLLTATLGFALPALKAQQPQPKPNSAEAQTNPASSNPWLKPMQGKVDHWGVQKTDVAKEITPVVQDLIKNLSGEAPISNPELLQLEKPLNEYLLYKYHTNTVNQDWKDGAEAFTNAVLDLRDAYLTRLSKAKPKDPLEQLLIKQAKDKTLQALFVYTTTHSKAMTDMDRKASQIIMKHFQPDLADLKGFAQCVERLSNLTEVGGLVLLDLQPVLEKRMQEAFDAMLTQSQAQQAEGLNDLQQVFKAAREQVVKSKYDYHKLGLASPVDWHAKVLQTPFLTSLKETFTKGLAGMAKQTPEQQLKTAQLMLDMYQSVYEQLSDSTFLLHQTTGLAEKMPHLVEPSQTLLASALTQAVDSYLKQVPTDNPETFWPQMDKMVQFKTRLETRTKGTALETVFQQKSPKTGLTWFDSRIDRPIFKAALNYYDSWHTFAPKSQTDTPSALHTKLTTLFKTYLRQNHDDDLAKQWWPLHQKALQKHADNEAARIFYHRQLVHVRTTPELTKEIVDHLGQQLGKESPKVIQEGIAPTVTALFTDNLIPNSREVQKAAQKQLVNTSDLFYDKSLAALQKMHHRINRKLDPPKEEVTLTPIQELVQHTLHHAAQGNNWTPFVEGELKTKADLPKLYKSRKNCLQVASLLLSQWPQLIHENPGGLQSNVSGILQRTGEKSYLPDYWGRSEAHQIHNPKLLKTLEALEAYSDTAVQRIQTYSGAGLTDDNIIELTLTLLNAHYHKFDTTGKADPHLEEQFKQLKAELQSPWDVDNPPFPKQGDIKVYPEPVAGLFIHYRENVRNTLYSVVHHNTQLKKDPKTRDENLDKLAIRYAMAKRDLFKTSLAIALWGKSPQTRPLEFHRTEFHNTMRTNLTDLFKSLGLMDGDIEFQTDIYKQSAEEMVPWLEKRQAAAQKQLEEATQAINQVIEKHRR